MIASKGDSSKMSSRRAKVTGWAAFDQQQKQKDVLEARLSNEPFPSLPSNVTSFQKPGTLPINQSLSVKPFSSVVLPSGDFAPPVQENKKSKQSDVGSSGRLRRKEFSGEDKSGSVFRRLKELYNWADDSLVKDIMAAAGNDFETSSSFLKAMVSDDSLEEHKDAKIVKSSSDSMEVASDGRKLHGKNDNSEGTVSGPAKACSHLGACAENDNENGKNELALCVEKLYDDCMGMNKLLGQLTCVPTEPEWEEDDVYLSYRKDAIKMMRAATRHSKAATNSFLKGDHFSAQQFSLKAQEEWEAAKSLNAKAAREILGIRNENNGIWRLDMHGLHAAEAVQALQEHLHMIETQAYYKGSSSERLPNGLGTKAEVTHALSFSGSNNMEKTDEQAFRRQYPKWLEVITGIGNHSRGGAALPTAVRTFLVDNGYRFDEARPGVITVRPKFRPT